MALSWISGYNNIDYLNQMIRSVEDTLSNDYNNLDNIPIIKIISSTSNPQNIWELKEGMYLIDGIVYVDNNTSYEVSNLFVSMTARLENSKYVLSAFIPFFKGLYEYILKSDSTEYEEHQIVILATHERMLTRYNETPYEPNGDYNPATKKYVDDKANEIITELDNIGVNKETITSLKEENRIRDIKLQALLSETSDRNISISEDTRYFDMPLSIDNGIVTINEMIGDTLVNVCDQEESVAITKSYTIENENHIALQGEYDGSCRPIVHGNTLVNHNADWDGNLQTGIETSASGIEDVQVEGIKGQEVSVVVEGNTVLNHALGKTSAVVSSIESENEGNYVDLTVANDMSSVVEIEGRTMVNVCDQKDPIAITKSYTVENSGNHIALQGEYDGSCRPVIQGNTMVNLMSNIDYSSPNINNDTELNYFSQVFPLIQNNKTYTIVFNNYCFTEFYISALGLNWINVANKNIFTFTVNVDDSTFDSSSPRNLQFKTTRELASDELMNLNIMIFEGDLTQTPELIPTEYVEGLKSSFEDGYIPTNLVVDKVTSTLVSNGNEGGYVVGKSTYINKDILANNKITVLVTYDGNYSKNIRLGGGVYSESIIQKGTKAYVLTKLQNPTTTYNVIQPYTENTSILNESCNVTIHCVLEGDWTHLTEEDWNNLGKYKVEYKVTGKNKLYKVVQGSFYQSDIYYDENGVQFHCGEGLVRKGVTYTTNFGLEEIGYAVLLDNNRRFVEHYFIIEDNLTITPSQDGYLLLRSQSGIGDTKFDATELQLEEGTTPTEYEPYKSYTKTFYLNSPLLEGDTIEDVNGVATHIKRYGKVILDGSEDENWSFLQLIDGLYDYRFNVPTLAPMDRTLPIFCDNLLGLPAVKATGDREEGVIVYPHNENYSQGILFTKTYQTVDELKQWLQANPTTVVHKLLTPIYEKISTESILCDSYVNGHLDFDSAVPIEKVVFRNVSTPLKYIQDNTNYIIQFESDNIGYITGISIPNGILRNINVAKGKNVLSITSGSNTSSQWIGLAINGIGFNASNIVVTEAIDADFGYFEGLKSSYECEVTEDGKYKVDVKVTGKNLFDKNDIVVGSIDNNTGASTDAGTSRKRSSFIKVKPNTSYTINQIGNSFGNMGSDTLFIHQYDYSYNHIQASGNNTFSGMIMTNSNILTFTTENNTKFVRFRTQDDRDITGANIQLEEGTVATSYEPYFESTKTFYLNSPLLEGDKIVTKNGKVYHYHKMGKVVFDGSENWVEGRTTPTGKLYGEYDVKNHAHQYNIESTTDTLPSCPANASSLDTRTSNGFSSALNGEYQYRIYIHGATTINDIKQWLRVNPTTVVYELLNPYYELVDEYNNTILDIPNTVAHLTHTSAVPVNNTVFTNYKDELNVLEPNTQYRLMFDCDKANIPFTVTLGGTSQEVTSKKGTHSLLITTPSTLVDKNLVIDGIGRCGIDNIRIFKGKVEYDYVKGLWSGYEERKLDILPITCWYYNTNGGVSEDDNGIITIIEEKPTYKYHPQIIIGIKGNFMLNNTYTIILKENPGNYDISLINSKDYSSHSLKVKNNKCIRFKYIKEGDMLLYYNLCKVGSSVDSVNNIIILEGDWTDNPPTYEEVMANEGKYAVKVKLDTNATIFGKGGRL